MASALLRQLVILTTYLADVVTDPRMAKACTELSDRLRIQGLESHASSTTAGRAAWV